jgi:starvation-inducible outer membrane lipoprotein
MSRRGALLLAAALLAGCASAPQAAQPLSPASCYAIRLAARGRDFAECMGYSSCDRGAWAWSRDEEACSVGRHH